LNTINRILFISSLLAATFIATSIVVGLVSLAVNSGYIDAVLWFTVATVLSFGYSKYRNKFSSDRLLPLFDSRVLNLLSAVTATILVFLVGVMSVGILLKDMPAISRSFNIFNFAVPVVVFAYALVEEIVFRGFIFGWMLIRLPVYSAACFSSIIFSCSHYPLSLNLLSFIYFFLMGACFALICVVSRSLLPAACAHATFNYPIGTTQFESFNGVKYSGLFVFQDDGGASRVFQGVMIFFFSLIAILLLLQIRSHKRAAIQSREPKALL
jgi:membrane protease YdiL (CAAX protease family)